MRLLAILLALVMAGASAQDVPQKKKKAAGVKKISVKAHAKPTPEQIRKFNELEKKQK